MMEHRQGARIKIRLPVLVQQGNRVLGWFTSRDISNGGIALKGGADVAHNTIVTLSFEVKRFNKIISETTKALVIYKNDGHIGLMWTSRSISLNRMLPQAENLEAA